MFKTIVVAADLTGSDDRALAVAERLTAAGDVGVELLTIAPGADPGAGEFELHHRAVGHGWPASAATVVTAAGHEGIADAIVEHLRSLDEPLLVMSASTEVAGQGRSGGSVSTAVLAMLDRPVLLVGPHAPSGWPEGPSTPIACVTPTTPTEPIVEALRCWIDTFPGSTPWVIEVVPPLPAPTAPSPAVPTTRSWRAELTDRLTRAGLLPRWEVVHDADPAAAIDAFARRVTAPVLIAVSEHWPNDPRSPSVVRRIVRTTTGPVLVTGAARNAAAP